MHLNTSALAKKVTMEVESQEIARDVTHAIENRVTGIQLVKTLAMITTNASAILDTSSVERINADRSSLARRTFVIHMQLAKTSVRHNINVHARADISEVESQAIVKNQLHQSLHVKVDVPNSDYMDFQTNAAATLLALRIIIVVMTTPNIVTALTCFKR